MAAVAVLSRDVSRSGGTRTERALAGATDLARIWAFGRGRYFADEWVGTVSIDATY